ncbi:tRNA adenosine deaminase-associated protein [Spelaeicoccus albus]|uniref:Putative tRNA adenosine deaminase-associated protein n=1 Tax=Spelaeicoccus albus TaxID=1280376 RepID=A0A7Z0A8Z8_9MICO|nr:tRNA adenosine deaminase-associated protein [Spelaeicoccus albus]NYI65778.1 putative tRNA adenosine deaminase-associated protein [Spelaeicoccus albus]
MSYFTAVLADTGDGWRARDVDPMDSADMEDLVDTMRTVSCDGLDTVAVIEHEDEWFALVRARSDDDAKVFVSDVHAAARSTFVDVLADYIGVPARDFDADEEPDDDVEQDPAEPDDEDEEDQTSATAVLSVNTPAEWGGDIDVLEARGIDGEKLCALVEEHSEDPGQVLTEIGETVGFSELLDALR